MCETGPWQDEKELKPVIANSPTNTVRLAHEATCKSPVSAIALLGFIFSPLEIFHDLSMSYTKTKKKQ